jgi:hypothetical protein
VRVVISFTKKLNVHQKVTFFQEGWVGLGTHPHLRTLQKNKKSAEFETTSSEVEKCQHGHL